MNAADFLLPQDLETDSVAVLESSQTITYRSLARKSTLISHWLMNTGVQEGDRILIFCENSSFWIASYLGALRLGIVSVPLSPNISPSQLQIVIEESEPKVVFTDLKHLGKLELLLSKRSCFTPSMIPDDGGDSPAPVSSRAGEDAIACVMFTSGSSAKPRGVVVSHRNIIANTESILSYLSLTSSDRMMVVLPFYYCFGTSLLHTHLRAGGSLVLSRQFLFPDKVLKEMQEMECTGFAGVPTTFQILLRNSSMARMKFPHLRHVQQAGGRLPPDCIRKLQEQLPGVKIFIMYGQTEATARLSYLPPELLMVKQGSVGKGIPGVELQVLDKAGRCVRPMQVGEIVASGANVTLGYWNDPQGTRETYRNGLLYTGDLATVDEEGFIFIVDRARDFLKVGGYRVSAREVEDTLLQFSGVRETAVIGVPDDILGEAIKAFVVPSKKNQSFISQFQEDCLRSLPSHLVPKETVFVDSLPKNSAGKIMKSRLREIK